MKLKTLLKRVSSSCLKVCKLNHSLKIGHWNLKITGRHILGLVIAIGLGIFLFKLVIKPTSASWYATPGWAFRQKVTIDHTKVSGGPLTAFPVLVKVTDTKLKAAQSTGNDILFTSSDGTTKLNHEIESFNQQTGALIAWVATDLSSTTDTVLYVYYGNPSAADQSNKNSVWDASYKIVQHMKDTTTSTTSDSTSTGSNGTKGAASQPSETDGKIGKAQYFAGDTQYMTITDTSALDWTPVTQDRTLSFWFKPTVLATNNGDDFGFLKTTTVSSGNHYSFDYIQIDGIYYIGCAVYDNSWNLLGVFSIEWTPVVGTWYNISIVASTAGNNIIYINGQPKTTPDDSWTTSFGTISPTVTDIKSSLGNTSGQGVIDEYRLSSSVRSAGWILTEYNNESSPQTFLGFANQEKSLDPVAYFKLDEGTGATSRDSITTNDNAYFGGTTTNNWYSNTSFRYRQASAITNGSGSTQTDYQVQISMDTTGLVSSNKMRPDCGDIRVTDSDKKTDISYWVEPNTCGTTATKIWAKIPSITTSGKSLYIYYGSLGSTTTGSISNTFVRDISNLQGAWKLNEASGNAVDSSGNGNTLVNSGPTFTAGKFDNAGSFARVSNQVFYILNNDQVGLNMTSSFSISAWVNATDPTQWQTMDIVAKQSANCTIDNNYTFTLRNSATLWPRFTYEDTTGTAHEYNGSAITNKFGTWHHLVMDYTSGSAASMKFYVDNVENSGTWTIGDGTGSLKTNTEPFALGYNCGEYYNGLLDEVRVYNKILSTAEIADEYNNYGYVTTNYPNHELVRKRATTDLSAAAPSTEESPTFLNGPTWQTEDQCISGKCIALEGSNSNLIIPLSITNVQSVSFWEKNASSSGTIPLMKLTSGANISITTGTTVAATGFNSPTIYVNGKASTTVSPNVWNYIEVVDTAGTTANAIVVGTIDSVTYLKGFVDEIKFYDYGRTADQVRADYNNNSPKGSGVKIGQNSTDPLNKGLVGYWKMDEATWSGTLAEVKDSSGNSNDGQAQGATNGKAYPGAGKFGNGGFFDGVDDYVSLAQNSKLPIYSQATYSIALWVKGAVNQIDKRVFSEGSSSSNNPLFTIGTDNLSSNKLAVYIRNDAGVVQVEHFLSTSSVFDNTWHHVVWTDSNGTASLYIDGSKDATNFNYTRSTLTLDRTAIGAVLRAASSNLFAGSLDDVRVYARALSPSEVRQLYNFAPGPIAYWKFEEGQGSVVSDSSTYGNTGTWNGTGQHWVPGKFGSAGKFNGSTDYVSSANSLASAASGTMEAWIKPSGTYTNNQTIMSGIAASGAAGTIRYMMTMTSTSKCASGDWLTIITNGTSAQNVCSGLVYNSTNFPAGVWTHLVITYDGTSVKFYKDSTLINNVPQYISGAGTAQPYSLGRIGGYNGYYFFGQIDEAKIYNYARTQDQVVEDMTGRTDSGISLSGVSGSGKTTLGYWKFDEGQGTTAYDSSGQGNNGTLTNMSSPATAVSGWTQSGKFGKALEFDGIDDFVTLGNPTALKLASASAISAWINLGTNNAQHTIISKKGAAYNYAYNLFTSATGKLSFELSANGSTFATASGATTLSVGKWYHVVGTYIPSTSITVYVNGLQDGQQTTSVPYTIKNATALVGVGIEASTNNLFNGAIDEVKIYGFALTSDEILQEYNKGSSLTLGSLSNTSGLTGGSVASNSASSEYCIPGDTTSCTAPVGRWDFEEGKDNTCVSGSNDVCDTSGNGNDGAWQGTGKHYVPGKQGWAGNFNGVDNNQISLASLPSTLTGSTAYTVEMWTYLTTLSTKQILMSLQGADSNYPRLEYTTANKLLLYAGAEKYLYNTKVFGSSDMNKWWHFTFVVNGSSGLSNWRVYINGTNDSGTAGADSGSYVAPSTYGTIGGAINGYYVLNGKMDQIRIYNYARTPAQVAWDFNKGKPINYWKMDECTGTAIHDAMGNNDGTLTNSTPGTCSDGTGTTNWNKGVSGKYNGSIYLDGSSNYISVTNPSAINSLTNNVTFSAWVNPTTIINSDRRILGSSPTSGNKGFGFGLHNGNLYFTTFGVKDYESSTTVSTDNWYHIVAVMGTDNGVTFYLNGVQKDTVSGTNPATANAGDYFIGARGSGGTPSEYFAGQIDDVQIYNYALNSTQVKTLYNQGSAVRFGP